MKQLYYFSYEIATVFLFSYVGLFSTLKFSIPKSVLILAGGFLATTVVDLWSIFYAAGEISYFAAEMINFAVFLSLGQLISKKKGFRAIFTTLCAMDFILPGNILCSIVYNRTADIFSSILLQVLLQSVALYVLVKLVSRDYKENENDIVGWGSVCLVPFLFYISITSLSVWPMNLIRYPAAIPGIILLFILMVVTFCCSIRMYTRKGSKQKQDMSLVFLAEYSDRLKSESAKVNEMSSRIEEMSNAMVTVTTEITELLDNGQYDEIRTLVAAIKSDSKIINTERKCANSSINSIALEAEEYAKRCGVELDCHLNVPENLGPVEFEYAVVVDRLFSQAIKGCSSLNSKKLTVTMYPSGAWINIEMRTKIMDYDSANQNPLEMEKKASKINDEISASMEIPEVNAFIKKYEVQHSTVIKMGVLNSEFNVRIN